MNLIMKQLLFICMLWSNLLLKGWAQEPSSNQPIGHCHNDYRLFHPFTTAFEAQMASIEADVFFKRGKLFVAHTPFHLNQQRTLDKLYLQPLAEAAREGKICNMQLVIDIKNNRKAALREITEELSCYDDVFNDCSPIKIIISGKRPPQKDWDSFPSYIYFDGRLSEKYSETQQSRIGMMSDNFRHYKTRWKLGFGTNEKTLKKVVALCHAKGEKIRFWNAPDNKKEWAKLKALGVDIINTDNPIKLNLFLHKDKAPTADE